MPPMRWSRPGVPGLTQGRASYAMEPSHYSDVPRNVAEEVRTIPANDMDMAIDSGLAEPLDAADPDSPVSFEGIEWTFNAHAGAWVPST